MPLLLLYADADPLVSPKQGEALPRPVPDARFVSIRESSHFAHVDTPEKVVAELLPFLAEAATMVPRT